MKRFLIVCFSAGVLLVSSGLAAKKQATPAKPLKPLQTKAIKQTSANAGLIDVNRADLGQLMSLPGMGEAWAAGIIHNRPYANKTQLRSRGVIPLAEYKKIQAQIVARH